MRFQLREPIVVKKETKKQKIKEEKWIMGIFDLSLSTWILIIIIAIVCAKKAHKFTTKKVFGWMKKKGKELKKDWDEA